jgi:glycosyltransferase involved in cell wall biosynthesis
MGTCGRAFFRLYCDHDLPEFIFPYEPDYTTLWHYSNEDLGAFLQKFGLAPTRRRLLYCGRLVPVKRVDLLLQAFISIAPQRPKWDLVIAGDGPLRKQLEAMIPPDLKDRVKWLGFLQFADAAITYRACEVLVHPAEYEPWGLVIVEAVACEKAVITTSVVGAAVEMVKHNVNGIIVPPRSAEALADAISQITVGQRAYEMSWPCAAMLEAWRRQADPIDSIRDALRYLNLIASEREFKTVCEDLWRPKPKADNQTMPT